MEPLTIFASSVGFIGAFHLLSLAVERLGKGKYNTVVHQGRRKDWYCFFALSDLLGTQPGESDKAVNRRPTVSETERLEQRRRSHAQRPRLQA